MPLKDFLLDILVCPACLPAEQALSLSSREREGGDILEGTLTCKGCGRPFPIVDGMALLLPAPPAASGPAEDAPYEASWKVSSYLWTHYGDLLGEEEATRAYGEWAGLLAPSPGFALDAGCAAGRMTFELARSGGYAVGLDTSPALLKAARTLLVRGSLTFPLKEEGRVYREVTLRLPEAWDREGVEFCLGDAQSMPFRGKAFGALASLNLIDRLPRPLAHLREMTRVAREVEAQFLFSDPFSWSEDFTPEEEWLGGHPETPTRGIDQVCRILTQSPPGTAPAWSLRRRGRITWKIRDHRNRFECIRSAFLLVAR